MRRRGKPPITTRWVDVNKGDEENPNYRSRSVVRQLKAHAHSGTNYFAPAPPLEALRTIVSLAATPARGWKPDWNPSSETQTQLSFVDVSKAYLNAKVDLEAHPTFVELPREDNDHTTMCGDLWKHMYGTRMAADGWSEECSTMLVKHAFSQGIACPNVPFHSEKRIACSVHGGDFTSSGSKLPLDWFE